MNNNLYFNRHNFYDFSVSKYLTRNYAAKIQLTVGLARSNGENRTPDSTYTYNGNEWIGTKRLWKIGPMSCISAWLVISIVAGIFGL